MTLKHYSKRYEVIVQGNLPKYRKDLAIASLISDMESNLNIPMHKNLEWEQENSEVIELYNKIASSRKL